jgi:hypothetical protein
MLGKEEILNWNRKYDKDYSEWTEKEKELGDKFRRTKELSKDDLIQVVEWKFNKLKGRKDRILRFIVKNDDRLVRRISSDVFRTTLEDDSYRIKSLDALHGVGPALASTILTFYDPKNYGVHDIHVWREFFGDEPSTIFTGSACYLKLLAELRKIANRYDLDARTVEKAYFKKNLDEQTFCKRHARLLKKNSGKVI